MKALLFIILTTAVFFLQSCASEPTGTIQDVSSEQEQLNTATSWTPQPSCTSPLADISPEIASLRYSLEDSIFADVNKEDNRNVKIVYPQIVSSVSADFESANEVLKESATNDYLSKWELKGLQLEQEYSIKLATDSCISVVFSATPYVLNTAHPMDICHSATVNILNTDEPLMTLADVVPSFDTLFACIDSGDYEVTGALNIYDKAGLRTQIEQLYSNVDIAEHKNDFFLEPNNVLCIIVSGLGHGAGDYSIIRFFSIELKEGGGTVSTPPS